MLYGRAPGRVPEADVSLEYWSESKGASVWGTGLTEEGRGTLRREGLTEEGGAHRGGRGSQRRERGVRLGLCYRPGWWRGCRPFEGL